MKNTICVNEQFRVSGNPGTYTKALLPHVLTLWGKDFRRQDGKTFYLHLSRSFTEYESVLFERFRGQTEVVLVQYCLSPHLYRPAAGPQRRVTEEIRMTYIFKSGGRMFRQIDGMLSFTSEALSWRKPPDSALGDIVSL